MSKRFFRQNWFLIATAAIGLCCAASQTHADNVGLPPGLQVAPANSAQILPRVSNARPYRQTVFVTCDRNLPTLSVANGRVVLLDKITAGHLLQIDKINCSGLTFNAAGAYFFNTLLKIDASHFVTLFHSTGTNDVTVSGPYYFNQGEIPKLVMGGNAATDRAYCTVGGTLWNAT